MITRWMWSGAKAGIAATSAMSTVLVLAQRAGLMGRQPPEQIVETVEGQVGVRGDEPAENATAVAAHVGFGTANGIVFAGLHKLLPIRPSVIGGTLYGLGLWFVSYRGWIPALGIMPKPEQDRAGRAASVLAAHIVYGASLGAALNAKK